VPIRFVYPSRTPVLRGLTNVLGASWALVVLALLAQYPRGPRLLLFASFVFPIYYVGLSAALEVERLGSRPMTAPSA
jgi:phosphatidylcholine synthase